MTSWRRSVTMAEACRLHVSALYVVTASDAVIVI